MRDHWWCDDKGYLVSDVGSGIRFALSSHPSSNNTPHHHHPGGGLLPSIRHRRSRWNLGLNRTWSASETLTWNVREPLVTMIDRRARHTRRKQLPSPSSAPLPQRVIEDGRASWNLHEHPKATCRMFDSMMLPTQTSLSQNVLCANPFEQRPLSTSPRPISSCSCKRRLVLLSARLQVMSGPQVETVAKSPRAATWRAGPHGSNKEQGRPLCSSSASAYWRMTWSWLAQRRLWGWRNNLIVW